MRGTEYKVVPESPRSSHAQVHPPKWNGPQPVECGPSSGAAASLIMLHGLSGSGTNCMDGFSSLKSISGLRMVFPSAPSVRTRCAPQLTPKHFDPNFKLSPPKNPLRHLHRLSPSPPELRFEHRAQRGTPTPPPSTSPRGTGLVWWLSTHFVAAATGWGGWPRCHDGQHACDA